ncbi:hypothetical protein BDB01DRAFT_854193 [Pilobolus umbonatus]|nr:hypothetical protein BDB01DRAFT_854193 [Pilobolus umbonatus]
MSCVKLDIDSDNKKELYVMYEIACFMKVKMKTEFSEAKMHFSVLEFHAFAHKILCQVKFNFRYVKGLGLIGEEGMERLWSYLDGFVAVVRGISRNKRRVQLLDSMPFFTGKKMATIADQKDQDEMKISWEKMVEKMLQEEGFGKKLLEQTKANEDSRLLFDPREQENYHMKRDFLLQYEDEGRPMADIQLENKPKELKVSIRVRLKLL